MNDVIVIENYVDSHCMRHLHLMSNFFIDRPSASQEGGTLKQEAGAWHYRAIYPYRGILDIACVENEKKFRRLVVWSLSGCESVRQAISQAESYFWATFRFRPGYVFMRRLPTAVDIGHAPELLGGMILLEADWMLERCVAVGGSLK